MPFCYSWFFKCSMLNCLWRSQQILTNYLLTWQISEVKKHTKHYKSVTFTFIPKILTVSHANKCSDNYRNSKKVNRVIERTYLHIFKYSYILLHPLYEVQRYFSVSGYFFYFLSFKTKTKPHNLTNIHSM